MSPRSVTQHHPAGEFFASALALTALLSLAACASDSTPVAVTPQTAPMASGTLIIDDSAKETTPETLDLDPLRAGTTRNLGTVSAPAADTAQSGQIQGIANGGMPGRTAGVGDLTRGPGTFAQSTPEAATNVVTPGQPNANGLASPEIGTNDPSLTPAAATTAARTQAQVSASTNVTSVAESGSGVQGSAPATAIGTAPGVTSFQASDPKAASATGGTLNAAPAAAPSGTPSATASVSVTPADQSKLTSGSAKKTSRVAISGKGKQLTVKRKP